MALRLVLDRRVEAWRAGPFGRLALHAGITVARVWRSFLRRTVFVGITGTAGKTTAKELTLAALRTQLRVTGNPGTQNRFSAVGATILRARPRDEVCVVEVAASEPGGIARISALVAPRVALVTSVGVDHQRAFATIEDVAAEKSALLAALPAEGVAILNADDPLVRAMAVRTRARIILAGEAEDAELRATEVGAAWPETLAFTVHHGDVALPVRTRLLGRHQLPAVLGALGAALALGVPLEDAVAAIETAEPTTGRMSPAEGSGIHFVRDDYKAPLWGFDAVLAFLAEAQAPRKRLVVGHVTNFSTPRDQTYRRLARRALEVVDEVIVVGPRARHVENLAAHGLAVTACTTTRAAAEHLRSTALAGELVLLKSADAPHLARIPLVLGGRDVRCWREACGRRMLCDSCSLLSRPG
jgi:UDP-N-acetylmuramyl pentapeptide synthase